MPSPEDVLVCVDPAKVDQIWPHARLFLQSAYETGRGDDDLDSLKADIDKGSALLWIVWDGNGILSATVTKIISTPKRKLCVISACGGREVSRWIRFISEIEQYAKSESCDAVRITGRPGWAELLKEYRQPWICLQKDLT